MHCTAATARAQVAAGSSAALTGQSLRQAVPRASRVQRPMNVQATAAPEKPASKHQRPDSTGERAPLAPGAMLPFGRTHSLQSGGRASGVGHARNGSTCSSVWPPGALRCTAAEAAAQLRSPPRRTGSRALPHAAAACRRLPLKTPPSPRSARRPVWQVWRQVRAGDANCGAAGAGGGVPGGVQGPRVPGTCCGGVGRGTPWCCIVVACMVAAGGWCRCSRAAACCWAPPNAAGVPLRPCPPCCRCCPRAALQSELDALLKDYVGRPSPLYHADRLSEHYRRRGGSACAGVPGRLPGKEDRMDSVAGRWSMLLCRRRCRSSAPDPCICPPAGPTALALRST